MKKAVVFDGDGTLWYPSSTMRAVAPHWVYDSIELASPLDELIITPNTVTTLSELGSRGILRILLSACPLPTEAAIENRRRVASHVKIDHLLDDIWVSPDIQDGKSEELVRICNRHNLLPAEVIMVGDTYKWDCQAAESAGMESVLISSDYSKQYEHLMLPNRVIADVSGLLTILGEV